MLVLSPLASIEGRAHLLDVTKCSYMLFGEGFEEIVMQTAQKWSLTAQVPVPDQSVWLEAKFAAPYSYARDWETAWKDPVVTFHTSGTTGLPKPITWVNAMMNYNDASAQLPRGDENITALIGRTRYYTTTGNGPGVSSSLQHSVWRGAVVVFGPPHRWPDAALATEILHHARVGSMMTTPHIIETMAKDIDGRAALHSLELLLWTGAPLVQEIGVSLRPYVRLGPVYGTTECAGLSTHVCADPADWNLYEFQGGQGIEFDKHAPDRYEMVIRRWPKASDGSSSQPPQTEAGYVQPVFCAFPELTEWRSHDLFAPHQDPGKIGLWAYQGRKDEFVMLSTGVGLQPTLYEPLITALPEVRGALIGGRGRITPFLLLQFTEKARSGKGQEVLDKVWSSIEREVNIKYLGDLVKLRRDKVVIGSPEKPFVWTEKGTVVRSIVLQLYQREIENLYA